MVKRNRFHVVISEAEFLDHRENYDGLCVRCGQWTCGGVEPDANDYPCDSCGSRTVVGAEEALISGNIEIC